MTTATYRSEHSDMLLAVGAAMLALVTASIFFWARSASLLVFLYPAAVGIVAVFLYRRHPVAYLAFVWWVWFLTPAVRRMVDFQDGYSAFSPIMIAPHLATLLTLAALVRFIPRLRDRSNQPFVLILVGIAIGYAVGVYRSGPFAASYDVLQWILPVATCFYVAEHARAFPAFQAMTVRLFTAVLLLLGVYGLIQFVFLPAWDAHWMIGSAMTTIGKPEPFKVRVFGTLNSPGPFGIVLMAGLLTVLSADKILQRVSMAPGLVALLLSLVRAAWGGLVVGIAYMAFVASGSRRVVLIRSLLVVGLLAVPLLVFSPSVSERVGDRVDTLTDIKDDGSYKGRARFYEVSLPALLNPVGRGVGSTGLATKLSQGQVRSFDSGLLNIPYVLGWFGGIPYLIGVILLLLRNTSWIPGANMPFLASCGSVVICTAVMLLFVNTLVGVSGMIFWPFLGLVMAGNRWESNRAHQEAALRGVEE